MRQVTDREKKIFAVTLAVILVFVGINFVIKPIKKKEGSLTQEIREELKILKRDLQTIEKEKKLHQHYEDVLVPFYQKNSDEEEMSVLLSQMQTLATQAGLRIGEMKPQKIRKTEFCKFLSLSLALEGPFLNIIRFLYAVQGPPYELGVEEFVIESKPTQPNMLNCRVDLSRLLIPAKNEN